MRHLDLSPGSRAGIVARLAGFASFHALLILLSHLCR